MQWLEETKKVGSVIRMVLRPISDILQFYYDYNLKPDNQGFGNIVYFLFLGVPKNYCEIMFGKISYQI